MPIAPLIMAPDANIARSVGLKPIVALGHAVSVMFPVVLINTPAGAAAFVGFSGPRFAGRHSHKALGPGLPGRIVAEAVEI